MQARMKLTPKQERAVLALLREPTVERAAETCGVSPVTLWRWQKLPAFQSSLEAARRECLANAVAQLQRIACKAVSALETTLDGRARAATKVSAARAVIEFVVKLTEVENIRREVDDLKRLAARSAEQAQGKVVRIG